MEYVMLIAFYIIPIIIIKMSNKIHKKYFHEDLIKDSNDLCLTFLPILNVIGSIIFLCITLAWIWSSRPESSVGVKVKQILFKIAR